ncbi:MAG: T9SS type A sorting domain-containing protein, partial [Paludibacter sp.]
NVTVPSGTYQCWLVGNFNSWNNNLNQMIKVDSTHYTLTLNDSTFAAGVTSANLGYKYLSGGGNWAYVEKDSVGAEIPNRVYTNGIDVVRSWATTYMPSTPLPITVRTGDDFVLPVTVLTNLSLQNAINSYQFELNYNPQKMKYIGFSSNNTISNSGIVQINSNQSGKLIIGYAESQYLLGSGVLLNLNFKAIEAGHASPQIDKFIFNTDSTINVVVPSVLINQIYGDIDQNSYIQAYDAALALQYSIGLDPIPTIEPLPWSAWRIVAADVDKSGSVTANDAGIILQYAVKLIDTFPAAAKVNPYKAPAANNSDVSIVKEGNNLIFRSFGNLIGLNVSVTENFSALGTPIFNNQSMMHATNISSDQFMIGLATANSPANAEVIMTIPIKDTFIGAIVFKMVINTTPKESIVSVASSGTNDAYDQAVCVYPNPAKDKVWIKIANEAASVVRVYNALGQMVYNSTIDNKQLMQIDTRSWYKEGIYQLQIVDANKTVIHNQKLIIK